MAVRSFSQTASDEAVRAATGHGRAHWFGLLDATGLREHKALAAHLASLGVDDWWAQGITVAYEQERGMRLPGQRADGTFSANASRTVPFPADVVYTAFANSLSAWLGAPAEVTGATEAKSVRFVLDGSRVVAGFFPTPSGKSKVQIQVEKLPSADAIAHVKQFWQGAFARLADFLASA